MSQFILALDTTGSRLNMGLDNGDGISRVRSLPLGRDLSTDLHSCLQAFMQPQAWSELGAIAILTGPGSYTGSRIGVVTARTLAQALNIPLYGFSSLAIAALVSHSEPGVVAISIPAQRNHVYGGLYEITCGRIEPKAMQPEQNILIEGWADWVQTSEASQCYEFDYSEENSIALIQTLMAIAQTYLEQNMEGDWATVLPNYAK